MRFMIGVGCAIALAFGLTAVLSTSDASTHGQGQHGRPNGIQSFKPLTTFGVPNGVAEIVDVSADGNTLVYSNASAGLIGFVDITNPAQPVGLPDVSVNGEPTSVSVSGNIAVAAVYVDLPDEGQPAPAFNPGELVVMDLSNPAAVVVLGSVAIGYQPDSVKLVERNGQLVAIVCIENQPVVVDANGLVTDDEDPGDPNDVSPAGLVQVVTLDLANVANSVVTDVLFSAATLQSAGLLFPNDPQPEFVAVNGDLAVVTLQENNGFARIDIANPQAPVLLGVHSSGIAGNRLADLEEDSVIDFNKLYPAWFATPGVDGPKDAAGNPIPAGSRFPDAVALSADGSVAYLADEGELNFTGGRGWSAFKTSNGQAVFEEKNLEQIAVRLGHYTDDRSGNKGIEVEGAATGVFGGNEFLFMLSERGSFMAVYDINRPRHPRFVQLLPTGISPEGVVCIPSRNLVVTADEVSGTLSVFEGSTGRWAPPASRPQLYSQSFAQPFTAISGLCSNAWGTKLYGIPDNAAPTEIYSIDIGGSFARVKVVKDVTIPAASSPVSNGNGNSHGHGHGHGHNHNGQPAPAAQAYYDGEGIALDTSIIAPSNEGWWIASEGDASSMPNLLVQVRGNGQVIREIQLPQAIDPAADGSIGGNMQGAAGGQTIRSNGFEGVTVSADGRYLLAVIQRDFAGEFSSPRYARVVRYDLMQISSGNAPSNGLRFGGDWDVFFVRLDSDSGSNWAGLSEISTIGPDQYIVIERDKGIGVGSQLKKVYAFDLSALTPDADGIPDASDTVVKAEVVDVLAEFFPYEKIEGLAVTPQGDLWVGLDNDGGEIEPRLVNTGTLVNPLP